MISFYDAHNDVKQNHIDYLINYIDNYILFNRCCINYPNCTHPKEQTDSNLLNTNDNIISLIRQDMFNKFELFVQQDNLNITYLKCWGLRNKGSNCPTWHNHSLNNLSIEVSFIMYLSDTNLGTEFEADNYTIITKPKKFTWVFFNSNISHQPQIGLENKMRYVLAGAIGANDGVN